MDAPRPQPGVAFALVFWGVLAVLSLVIGGPAQLAGIGPGLAFTEIFVFLAPSLVVARGLGSTARDFLRLTPVPARLILLGALIGAVNYPVAMAAEGGMRLLLPHLAERFDVGALLAVPTGWSRVAMLIGVGVMAPLGEEIAFRGVIQRILRAKLGDGRAIALTAVLFAAIHFDPVGAPSRVELAVLFGAMAIWSGSLWVGMAAHAANNLTAMLLFYALGGRSDDDVPTLLQLAGLLAVGALATTPLMLLMRRWTQGCDSPRELPELRPRSIAVDLALWLAAMSTAFGLLIATDYRGWRLSLIDATTPYRQGFPEGTKHADLDTHLHALREKAEQGELSIETYRDFRAWLFEEAQAQKLDATSIEAKLAELNGATGTTKSASAHRSPPPTGEGPGGGVTAP